MVELAFVRVVRERVEREGAAALWVSRLEEITVCFVEEKSYKQEVDSRRGVLGSHRSQLQGKICFSLCVHVLSASTGHQELLVHPVLM